MRGHLAYYVLGVLTGSLLITNITSLPLHAPQPTQPTTLVYIYHLNTDTDTDENKWNSLNLVPLPRTNPQSKSKRIRTITNILSDNATFTEIN